jgi:hypothetical protein
MLQPPNGFKARQPLFCLVFVSFGQHCEQDAAPGSFVARRIHGQQTPLFDDALSYIDADLHRGLGPHGSVFIDNCW